MSWSIVILMLLLCVACHGIDDYFLQGCRAELKQKKNWEGYGEICKHDWIPALASHSIEWSVVTALPIFAYLAVQWLCFGQVYEYGWIVFVVILNAIIHFVIDDLKCNRYKINLCIDQTAHLIQIVMLVAVWAIVC